MFSFSHDGVTVASILDTRKPNGDGKSPVKIRVTFRRDRKYYSTGKILLPEEWSKLTTAKSKTANELKSSIQTSFDTVKSVASKLISEGGFSLEVLNVRLGRATSGTVNAAFTSRIETLKEEGRAGSELFYGYTLSNLEKFGGSKISFTSLTPDWLRKYEKWMLGRGMAYSTIGIYMRTLRAIINEAINAQFIKKNDYPFGKGKYEIPSGESRKLALTIQDIKKVISFDDGLEATPRYRDLWFLSYQINGINIGDLARLKDINLVDGEIRFYRAKTIRTTKKKKEIVTTLTPTIQALIDRWGVKDRKPDEYIFKYLTGKESPMEERKAIMALTKRINKKLKSIAESLGIPAFTTYSARHSFATVLKRSGTNVAFISESLGHPDVKTTENYLDSFEREERQKNAAILTNFPKEASE